jgi:hypothetical protein
MDNIAVLLNKSNFNFVNKINSNDYIEGIKDKINKYSNFIFCLLDNYDLILTSSPNKDKNIIFHQRISDILSQIDEENLCEKYNYNSKKFKSKLIQKNILDCSKNKDILLISCIYFFNDYYKLNFNLVNTKNNKIINTCKKDYPVVYIYTDNNNYYLDTNCNDNIKNNIKNNNEGPSLLSEETNFILDIQLKDVYKLHLDAISKYKMNNLKDIAKDNNIILDPKIKKQDIYDKINIHMLNLI